MFYTELILGTKGPLAKIWVASHWDKRLSKSQILQTNVHDSVNAIINPSRPLALRLSGQLLLGIVRIHSKQVEYLQKDCDEALIKLRMTFRPITTDADGKGVTTIKRTGALNVLEEEQFRNLELASDIPEDYQMNEDDHLADFDKYTSHEHRITLASTPTRSRQRAPYGSDFHYGLTAADFTPFNEHDTPMTPSKRRKLTELAGSDGEFSQKSIEFAREESSARVSTVNFNVDDFGATDQFESGFKEDQLELHAISFGERSSFQSSHRKSLDVSFDQPEIPVFENEDDAALVRVEFEKSDRFKEQTQKQNVKKVKHPVVVGVLTKQIQNRKKNAAKTLVLKKNPQIPQTNLLHQRTDASDLVLHRLSINEQSDAYFASYEYGFKPSMLSLKKNIRKSMHTSGIEGLEGELGRFVNECLQVDEEEGYEQFDIQDLLAYNNRSTEEKEQIRKSSRLQSLPLPLSESRVSEVGDSERRFTVAGTDGGISLDVSANQDFIVEMGDGDFETDLNIQHPMEFEVPVPIEKENETHRALFEEEAVEEDVLGQESKDEKDHRLRDILGEDGSLFNVSKGRSKLETAQLFFKLLELKTKDEVDFRQTKPCADILYSIVR